jgi:hypothetical protein
MAVISTCTPVEGRGENMKVVQVIDGALNCAYDVFEVTAAHFGRIFPGPGQDVEFVEDFFEREGEAAQAIFQALSSSRVDKKSVKGIQGTLFCGLEQKRRFYPTKREGEMVTGIG